MTFDKLFKRAENIDNDETTSSMSKLLGIDKTRGKRTQKWGTGQQRLHQNMVPDMHKVDPTLNYKVEVLRDKPGKMILSKADLDDVISKYNVTDLSTDNTRSDPKFLGTSDIMLYHDNWNNCYCIEKLPNQPQEQQ